jgi:hypothetical protein
VLHKPAVAQVINVFQPVCVGLQIWSEAPLQRYSFGIQVG